MIVLDVNVLIAAFRQDHPHHDATRPWFERILEVDGGVIVPDTVWVGFVRVVTNPRIFSVPATIQEAFAFVDAVREASNYRSVPGHLDGLDPFRTVCVDGEATANLVADAYIASIALAYACPVASFDRDFRRFDGLQIVVPSGD